MPPSQISGAERMAVVLVHGWTCDASIWSEQREVLEARFQLLVPELPGHGDSPLPARGIKARSFANALHAAMRRAKVDRAVLVGHSMGGVVIRQFARLHPEKVVALVFVDTPFDLTETPEDRAWLKAFRGRDGRTARRAFIKTLFHRSTPAKLREQVTEKMLSSSTKVAVQSWRWMSLPEAARPDDHFAGPVLLIEGESNEVELDVGLVRAMFPRFKRVVTKRAGHFVMIEKPAAFNRTLLAFLKRVTPEL